MAWWLSGHHAVLLPVTRNFAKIVVLDEGFGLNILKFNMRQHTVEQITIGAGSQEAKFTDLRFEEATNRLTFIVDGKIIEFPIYEFSDETLVTMQRPDNWKNLTHGLKIKSPKTVEWLKKRGIY